MLSILLLLVVLIPAGGAILAGILRGKSSTRVGAFLSAAVALLALGSVGLGYGTTFRQGLAELPWLADTVSSPVFGVLLDPLASLMLIVVTVIGFVTFLFSLRYASDENRDHPVPSTELSRYNFWLLLFLASMVGVAISPNFLQLFVFWELTTICSWALISFYRTPKSLAAGLKALVMTSFGGLFFLGGILVLFVKAGSLEFDALGRLSPKMRAVVFLFLMVAAWAKAAQVPFHTWLPDAMEAPTTVSAYLHAAAMVKAGVFLMARTVAAGLDLSLAPAAVLGAAAVVTMFIALSYYFIQDDLKRLLAYSTIAHLAYVLLGVALGAMGSLTGLRGGALHILCHGFGKATLFFCVGAVAWRTGSRSIQALGGLARPMPLTATAFFVGIATVTGVPPFACFWSKFTLLAGAMKLPGAAGPVLVVLVLVESLISFAWLLHVGQKVFLGERTPAASINSDPPPTMCAALVLLMIGCLVVPAIGLPLVGWIGR